MIAAGDLGIFNITGTEIVSFMVTSWPQSVFFLNALLFTIPSIHLRISQDLSTLDLV